MQSAPSVLSSSGSFAAMRTGPAGGFDDLSGLSGGYEPRRSGASVIGWLFLAALIFGGVGVVLYVALGERAGRTAPPAAGAAAVDGGDVPVKPVENKAVTPPVDARPDGAAVEPAPEEIEPDRADREVKPDRDARPDRDRKDRDAKKSTKDKEKEKVPEPAAAGSVPSSAAEAKKLSAQAKALLKTADWDGAYEAYSRLARSSYLKKDAELGMANASWQLNRVDRTIKHAQAAIKAGAGIDAKKMLGHAYFKKGNYSQALIYYDEILAAKPGDKEVRDAADAARKRLGQ